MRMTVLASGSKGNSTVVASANTRLLIDAGLSCRELLKRMAIAEEDPTALDAILITHEHKDHIAGLSVLARRLQIPVYLTEPTHHAWIRTVTPRTTMTYAKWLEHLQKEKEARAEAAAISSQAAATSSEAVILSEAKDPRISPLHDSEPDSDADPCDPFLEIAASVDPDPDECDDLASTPKRDPAFLPAVEYFHPGTNFSIGDISITPFTIPHDAADPCGFVFESQSESIRMAIATDLGYMPPNVKSALKRIDVLLLESNHDLEMLKDGPYPWGTKQRILSRVGHLSNLATAEFLARDYDGCATWIVLGHLSEANNAPELALISAEQAVQSRMTLLGNRILLARQSAPLAPICL
jgi:phosphoribosyl 1,2-cyclic phosphodiesterase